MWNYYPMSRNQHKRDFNTAICFGKSKIKIMMINKLNKLNLASYLTIYPHTHLPPILNYANFLSIYNIYKTLKVGIFKS